MLCDKRGIQQSLNTSTHAVVKCVTYTMLKTLPDLATIPTSR